MLVPFTEADYVMDMAQFDMMTDGDVVFRHEVVTMFLEILDESTQILTSPDADVAAWGKEAHKLKGAALNMGARRLGMVCLAMEHCEDQVQQFELIDIYLGELKALRQKLTELAAG